MTVTTPIHLQPLRFKTYDDGIASPVHANVLQPHLLRGRVKINPLKAAMQVFMDGVFQSQLTITPAPAIFNWRVGVNATRIAKTDFDIGNVTIGSIVVGSDNLFSADFSSGGIVPPFTSYSHSGGITLAVGGGVLHAAGATIGSANARYVQPFPTSLNALYFGMDVRFYADMISAGGSVQFFKQDALVAVSYDFDNSELVVEYPLDTLDLSSFSQVRTDRVPFPISASTWYTLGVIATPWG